MAEKYTWNNIGKCSASIERARLCSQSSQLSTSSWLCPSLRRWLFCVFVGRSRLMRSIAESEIRYGLETQEQLDRRWRRQPKRSLPFVNMTKRGHSCIQVFACSVQTSSDWAGPSKASNTRGWESPFVWPSPALAKILRSPHELSVRKL